MMKHEFEELAGRTVTNEQYEAIEKLYMESTMNKQDFVKSIKQMLKAMPEQKNYKKLVMNVPDNSGYYETPNGCWSHVIDVELVDVNIKTGKLLVKKVPNSYRLNARGAYDVYAFDPKITYLLDDGTKTNDYFETERM